MDKFRVALTLNNVRHILNNGGTQKIRQDPSPIQDLFTWRKQTASSQHLNINVLNGDFKKKIKNTSNS